MREVTLILGEFEGQTHGTIVGVDAGALVCINKGLALDIAVGDFDSVNEEEFKLIKSKAKETIKLNPIKDDTDFTYAYLNVCNDYDRIYVYGGLGGRRDHEYMHVHTAMRDSRIILMSEQNKIQRLDSGYHIISKDSFQYISFFALTQATIDLKGFKYSLDNKDITPDDTYLTSNEIVDYQGIVTLQSGSVLMVQASPIKK